MAERRERSSNQIITSGGESLFLSGHQARRGRRDLYIDAAIPYAVSSCWKSHLIREAYGVSTSFTSRTSQSCGISLCFVETSWKSVLRESAWWLWLRASSRSYCVTQCSSILECDIAGRDPSAGISLASKFASDNGFRELLLRKRKSRRPQPNKRKLTRRRCFNPGLLCRGASISIQAVYVIVRNGDSEQTRVD